MVLSRSRSGLGVALTKLFHPWLPKDPAKLTAAIVKSFGHLPDMLSELSCWLRGWGCSRAGDPAPLQVPFWRECEGAAADPGLAPSALCGFPSDGATIPTRLSRHCWDAITADNDSDGAQGRAEGCADRKSACGIMEIVPLCWNALGSQWSLFR